MSDSPSKSIVDEVLKAHPRKVVGADATYRGLDRLGTETRIDV